MTSRDIGLVASFLAFLFCGVSAVLAYAHDSLSMTAIFGAGAVWYLVKVVKGIRNI